jgi:hypothetical protein
MDKQNKKTGDWFINQVSLYQNANSGNEAIKQNFIIRKAEFESIVASILPKKNKDPLQHELILGRRGSGKSTLLKRIQIELEENPKLNQQYIAINLPEEQASIYRLFDLWDEVLKELQIIFGFELKLKDYSEFAETQYYTRYLCDEIIKICTKQKRKIILLVDNFDRIVENFTDDGHLLRETLINHNHIQIIAGSTRMDEHFWKHAMPFFEFFRRHRLEALSTKEIHELINHWSQSLDIDELKDFVKNNPGKIENIRILTDGLPRTLQLFIQIILQNETQHGYDYLKKIMDNVTPLYQERLNNLTPQVRKIIAEMAFIWEACTTKQLVAKCKMESKLISANLKTLTEKGLVDKLETNKKNHLYRISERFFNMWFIITQGNPEQKRKSKWLSLFLENWYDASDFKKLTSDYIHNLKHNNMDYEDAMIHSKALSQCKFISTNDRDEIIELTEALNIKKIKQSLIVMPKKFKDIEQEVAKLVENKEFVKAIEKAQEIENEEGGEKYGLLAGCHYYNNDVQKAKAFSIQAIDKGHKMSLHNIALLFDVEGDYSSAEKYYRLAVENKILGSFANLALLYYNHNTNKELALALIKEFNLNKDDSHQDELELIIEIWNGHFNEIEKRATHLVSVSKFESKRLIQHLLAHQQKSLVLKLFQNPEFGKELQDKYQVFYYVTLMLNHVNEENLALKIPPELNATIEDVMNNLKGKENFYGYT